MELSSDSICWECKKACGYCCWSRSLKPIEGWKIQRSKIYEDGIKIVSCPEFEEDKKKR